MKFYSRLLRFLSVLTILIGAFFKIQHWEGGQTILLCGIVGTVVTLVIHFIAEETERKKATTNNKEIEK